MDLLWLCSFEPSLPLWCFNKQIHAWLPSKLLLNVQKQLWLIRCSIIAYSTLSGFILADRRSFEARGGGVQISPSTVTSWKRKNTRLAVSHGNLWCLLGYTCCVQQLSRHIHIFQINQVGTAVFDVSAPDRTSTRRWLLAPLAVGLALGCRRSLHGVAFVAGETHHVVVVEALANGAAVDRTTGMAARDGCPGERCGEEERQQGEEKKSLSRINR